MIKWIAIIIFALIGLLDVLLILGSAELERRRKKEVKIIVIPRGEWIPCSERLPRKEEQDDELGVLVTLGNGYSGLQYDYYFNGLWDDWNGYVIAWMPLPAPWKGAEDD